MNITIRRAVPEDNTKICSLQEEIAQIHHNGRPDLFREEARYYSDEAFFEKLNNPEHFVYIAENENGDVVGYSFAYIIKYHSHSTYRDFNSFYIDDICVAKAYRRNGIGKMLFDNSRKQASEFHCHNIDLGVWSFNRDAIAFYEKCGLRERMRRMEMTIEYNECNNL